MDKWEMALNNLFNKLTTKLTYILQILKSCVYMYVTSIDDIIQKLFIQNTSPYKRTHL